MLKRNKPLRRTGFSGPRKSMKKVSAKRRKHWNSDEGKAELAYMADVKRLPCCICDKPGPSDAHHCIHDRFGAAKSSGFDCIPLCKEHHQDGPEAIHNGKESWREKHGPDHGYIESTKEKVAILRGGLYSVVTNQRREYHENASGNSTRASRSEKPAQ